MTIPQLERLIAGPGGVYICNECVALCVEIIEEGESKKEQARLLGEGLHERVEEAIRSPTVDGHLRHLIAAIATELVNVRQSLEQIRAELKALRAERGPQG